MLFVVRMAQNWLQLETYPAMPPSSLHSSGVQSSCSGPISLAESGLGFLLKIASACNGSLRGRLRDLEFLRGGAQGVGWLESRLLGALGLVVVYT